MEISVTVKQRGFGGRSDTYTLNTEPTEKAISKAMEDVKGWLRKSVTVKTEKPII